MIRLVQRKLIIPRGDTGTFSVPVLPTLNTGDVAVFTIFNPLTHTKVYQKVIEINGDVLVIRLEHGDTVNLPVNKYVWDIKFYQNPLFIDEELVSGDEVDSYYAAYSLPECEIKPTGDLLLTDDDAPTDTIAPDYLNVLLGAASGAQDAKESAERDAGIATQKAELATDKADAASRSAEDAAAARDVAVEKAGIATNAAATATNAKNSAVDAKDIAVASASTAHTDAVNAAADAASALDSASRASASATTASNAAVTATEKANQIQNLTAEASTLSPGSSATASYSKVTGKLSLGIPRGADGKGIVSTAENADTSITITYTDNTTFTTTPLKGETGDAFHIVKTYTSVAAMNADYSGTDVQIGEFVMIVSTIEDPDNAKVYVKGDQAYNFVVDMSGAAGINGVGISSIQKTSTSGTVDTYTIYYTNNTTSTFTVTNGEDGSEYTVMVQDEQPTERTNKLWIPIQQGVVQQVPTVDEMNSALALKADKTEITVPNPANIADGYALVSINHEWVPQDGYGYNISEHTKGTLILENAQVTVSSDWLMFEELTTPLPSTDTIYVNINGTDYLLERAANNDYSSLYYAGGPISELSYSYDAPTGYVKMYIIFETEEYDGQTLTINIWNDKIGTQLIDNQYLPIKNGTGYNAIASGTDTISSGINSTAEGIETAAKNAAAHAEGYKTIASGLEAHSEGSQTIAQGINSHAEGFETQALGGHSHASGSGTIAKGLSSYSAGTYTIASARYSSVFGKYNVEDSANAWPEWAANTTYAVGDKVKKTSNGIVMPYVCKTANTDATWNWQHWSSFEELNYIEIAGNGSDSNHRSNAYALDWDGNGHFKGDVYVGCNADSTGGTKLATVAQIPDVQVNGTSIVNNGVANVPIANSTTLGTVIVDGSYGLQMDSGTIKIKCAGAARTKAGTNAYEPIVASHQHESTFYGLAKAAGDSTQSSSSNSVGTYTEDAKSAISQMLNGAVSVSGSTPSITAKAGVRYVCGECLTLNITTPASGIIDVVFESGSTPTVLTVTPPTGMTMKWANGFDPTSLEANMTYEINIMDGIYGVVGTWS